MEATPRRTVLALALAAACGGDDRTRAPLDAGGDAADATDGGADAAPACPPDLHVEDAPLVAPDCPDGPAAGEDDRLAEVLGIAGLSRETFGWSDADWAEATYRDEIFDPFALPGYRETHDDPVRGACLAREVAAEVDHAASGTHRLSRLVARAAARLGHPVDEGESETEPVWSYECEGTPLAAPLEALLGSLGGAQTDAEIAGAVADVPLDLQTALAPVVLALAEAADARADAWTEVGDAAAVAYGAALSSIVWPSASGFDVGDDALVGGLDGPWIDRLYEAAWRLAVALDHARPVLRGLRAEGDFEVDLRAPAGRVVLRDGADHVWEWEDADREPIALLVDAGGDDTYVVPAGGIVSLDQPVAVAIDLGGADLWSYEEAFDPDAGVGHRIPMDSGGRYGGDASYGPYALSQVCRQGGARFGVAVLEDLGGADDEYRTLRMGQGFAVGGVGILHDDGGMDSYVGESGVQGAAMFGIGLLVDDGGGDSYVSYTKSQGFGYTKGAGALVDVEGADSYLCDHGIPDEGGDPLYYTPQRPGTGNSSRCQGAGWGFRGDSAVPPTYWSGGLGVLRDVGGDDVYEASVFAQATAYWSGIGILAEGGGDDRYDAVWYAQAGAAHYSTAVMLEAGGHDVYGERGWANDMNLGAGNDYTLAVFVDGDGDDRYFTATHGIGSGYCNAIGLFVDGGGADEYRTTSTSSLGHAQLGDACAGRSRAITDGLFLDVGGADDYERVGETVEIGDDASWTQTAAGLATEHGAGIDAPDGDPTIRAR